RGPLISSFFRERLYRRKQNHLWDARQTKGNDIRARCRMEVGGAPGRERRLAPSLQFRPQLGEGSEFRALAKENVDLFFQRVGVVSRCANVLHVFPETLENLSSVVQDNHAVPGVAARAPQKISLMAAEGRRQSGAAAKEINGAGLAVVLGEDAAAPAFFRGKTNVGIIYLGHD